MEGLSEKICPILGTSMVSNDAMLVTGNEIAYEKPNKKTPPNTLFGGACPHGGSALGNTRSALATSLATQLVDGTQLSRGFGKLGGGTGIIHLRRFFFHILEGMLTSFLGSGFIQICCTYRSI